MNPQNIFMVQSSPKWWIKIGDFGITKRSSNDIALQTITGTLLYRAPEISGFIEDEDGDNERSIYTNAVDIWSFACLVYEMLALRVPFAKPPDLLAFCQGRDFPEEPLKLRASNEGIKFVKNVLVPHPRLRPKAGMLRTAPWICEEALQKAMATLELHNGGQFSSQLRVIELEDNFFADTMRTLSYLSQGAVIEKTREQHPSKDGKSSQAHFKSHVLDKLEPQWRLDFAGQEALKIIDDQSTSAYTNLGIFDIRQTNSFAEGFNEPPPSHLTYVNLHSKVTGEMLLVITPERRGINDFTMDSSFASARNKQSHATTMTGHLGFSTSMDGNLPNTPDTGVEKRERPTMLHGREETNYVEGYVQLDRAADVARQPYNKEVQLLPRDDHGTSQIKREIQRRVEERVVERLAERAAQRRIPIAIAPKGTTPQKIQR